MSTIERISYLLVKQGKQQKDLMAYLNLKKSTFSNWKKGVNKSYLKYIPNIAEYFGVTVDYLLGKTDTQVAQKNAAAFAGDSEANMLLGKLLSLDSEDRQTVDGLIDTLLKKDKYKKISSNVG